MKHEKILRHVRALAAATFATTLLATVAHSQESALLEETSEVTATVTAIEPETRMLTLRGEDGQELVVEAGDDVRNFDRIEAGDQVDVVFYEALLAEVADAPDTPDAETSGESAVPVVLGSSRAPLGEKLAGAAGMVYTAVVTIDAVDTQTNTVEFTGPGGQTRVVGIEQPEMQAFIRGLSPGDRVQVTYGEALAVSVSPSEPEEELAE